MQAILAAYIGYLIFNLNISIHVYILYVLCTDNENVLNLCTSTILVLHINGFNLL